MTATQRQRNETRLREWMEDPRKPDDFPLDTNAAFDAVEFLGYEIDRRRLNYYIERNLFCPPGKIFGRYAWQKQHILNLADLLEQRRRWLPSHPDHAHKCPPRKIPQRSMLQNLARGFEHISAALRLLVEADQDGIVEICDVYAHATAVDEIAHKLTPHTVQQLHSRNETHQTTEGRTECTSAPTPSPTTT